MKFKGQTIEGPSSEVLVIPKGDMNVVFEAQMVADYAEFEKLCPEPQPKTKLVPGTADPIPMIDEPNYMEEVKKWGGLKTDWMILKSLEASKDIEWGTVKMDDPSTYANWRTELEAAKFSNVEILEITRLVIKANGLSTERMEEATESFLAERAAGLNVNV